MSEETAVEKLDRVRDGWAKLDVDTLATVITAMQASWSASDPVGYARFALLIAGIVAQRGASADATPR